MKNNYGIGERLRKFREQSDLKILDFSRILGISHGYLSEVEQGKKQAGLDLIMSLKRNFPLLNQEWLLTGEGEMFRKAVGNVEVEKKEGSGLEQRVSVLEEKVNRLFEGYEKTGFEAVELPFFTEAVAAGVPTAIYGENVERLTVDRMLVKRPSKCFAVRVNGESMTGSGINDGDILIVERDTPLVNGKIVLARLNGAEMTVKKLEIHKNGDTFLAPTNPAHKRIKLSVENEATLVGAVIVIIRVMA